jgi:hypothetical protein
MELAPQPTSEALEDKPLDPLQAELAVSAALLQDVIRALLPHVSPLGREAALDVIARHLMSSEEAMPLEELAALRRVCEKLIKEIRAARSG